MLVFIKSWVREAESSEKDKLELKEVQRAFKVEDIKMVGDVTPFNDSKNKFFFFIILNTGEFLYSSLYDSKEDAEMAQVSAITTLNAIELYFERFKHVPEHHATPVMFQVVDPKQKKLVPGKISMFETPVFTIQI